MAEKKSVTPIKATIEAAPKTVVPTKEDASQIAALQKIVAEMQKTILAMKEQLKTNVPNPPPPPPSPSAAVVEEYKKIVQGLHGPTPIWCYGAGCIY